MLFQLDHVTKDYRGHRALDDLVVDVAPGAIGLLGPNGAGKSTLIKALLGLVRVTRGNATILGHDVRRAKHRVRESVGYMPEDDCLIPGLKGVETVSYAAELGGIPYRHALRRAHEILDYVGISEERYREVQTYSTGMKQKIKLALALVHSPQMVFLDEPTSGLDPQGRDKMLRMIRNLHEERGISIVVSTHILSDIEAACGSVMILGRGKLLLHDQLANLQRTQGRYKVRFAEGANENAGAFANSLDAAGLKVGRLQHDTLMLHDCGEHAPAELFRLAAERGVSIRSLESSKNTLEQIFLQAVDAQAAHDRATGRWTPTPGLAEEVAYVDETPASAPEAN
ncbi:MAG: ABC transporter ATP-binding protein [Planctomycetota bacterium]